jgi:NAD(P)-dependent dehydrogenase (short-subunit alcohol dehydrogenase family)
MGRLDVGRLEGRVAIVTGAAHGNRAAIGSVYAAALAREGAKVVVADVKEPGSVAADIERAGGAALPLTVDVRDEASVKAMVARTVEHFGKLDILVNNAGLGSNIPPVHITALSVADWDELMAVNVRGPFLCSRAAIPIMREYGYGKIINVGSSTMLSALPYRLHYVTSKGAILAMTRAMAKELGPYGIRVNTVGYSLISNAVTEAEFAAHPDKRKMIMGARAIPKDIYPADLVGTLVYLASPESDAMTGQFINIDGGQNFT